MGAGRLRRRGHDERGAAMVEFALLLPLLLLIIGCIIDGGRAFYRQIELTNAAREGVRVAIFADATEADVQDRAGAAVTDLTITTTLDASCPEDPGDDDQAQVTTSIEFDWLFLGPAMSLFGPETLPDTLDSTAVMRCGG